MSGERNPPKASQAKVDYHLKQLLKIFSRANDAAFLQMIWAVDALQSGREAAARPFLSKYPPHVAAVSSLASQFGVHRWELETLVTELFLVPKELPREQGNLVLDCSNFEAMRQTINRLRALENVESARYLSGEFTIWGEMHRIAQRQFHWQRGYFNAPQIYRYAYLYAQGRCADYFRDTYGFEITDLVLAGFGMFAAYQSRPWVARETSVPEVGLTDEIVRRALPMISCSRDQARAETAALIANVQRGQEVAIPTGMLPSILRKTPLIYVDYDLLISPVAELIIQRVTAGLYYDLISGGQDIINDANARFERYCIDLIAALMSQFEVAAAYKYGLRGALQDSPDVLVKHHGRLAVVAECKATKLTYLAQFAENPFELAKKQYAQIAKGIFQLWRFFSHVRRGLVEEQLATECHALVLTLDAFMQMARDTLERVFAEAHALADEDGNIAPEDRKPVVICPVYELESILTMTTEDSFLALLRTSIEDKYRGWMLDGILRDSGGARGFDAPKPYPFEMRNVFPWWQLVEEICQRASPT